MIWATDALLIAKVVDLLPQFVDRIVYGTPSYARKFWALTNSEKAGVQVLPWACIYRVFDFTEYYGVRNFSFKTDGTIYYKNPNYDPKSPQGPGNQQIVCPPQGAPLQLKLQEIKLTYVLDFFSRTMVEQVEILRQIHYWLHRDPNLRWQVPERSWDFSFGVNFRKIVDNSDLEQFFEQGRVVRTTVELDVASYLMDQNVLNSGLIEKIVQNAYINMKYTLE